MTWILDHYPGILKMYLLTKIVLLGQGFQKLEPDHQRHIDSAQTESTEHNTTPHSQERERD